MLTIHILFFMRLKEDGMVLAILAIPRWQLRDSRINMDIRPYTMKMVGYILLEFDRYVGY